MKRLLIAAALIALSGPALAQTPRAPVGAAAQAQEAARMNTDTEKMRWQQLRARFAKTCGDACPP